MRGEQGAVTFRQTRPAFQLRRTSVGRGLKTVQSFVEGTHEPGAVLCAAGGALDRLGQASGGFAEDDFGEGAAAVVLGQGGGVALDVGGECAGVPGQLEHDFRGRTPQRACET